MAAETASYAIVKTGGKQYKVAVGDIVKVEKIETEPGASVSLPVALVVVGSKVTTDAGELAKVSVTGEVLEHIRHRDAGTNHTGLTATHARRTGNQGTWQAHGRVSTRVVAVGLAVGAGLGALQMLCRPAKRRLISCCPGAARLPASSKQPVRSSSRHPQTVRGLQSGR